MFKYQSEIINEILEKRGHELSSLHYESECIDSWIEEVKGGYPKLCDYQSEWLNYVNENPIGEFPYETITDVTEATINNVVPYAYESAILKGNTLVNHINRMYEIQCEAGGYERFTIMSGKTLPAGTYILLYNVIKTGGEATTESGDRNTPYYTKVDGTKIYQGWENHNSTTGKKYWVFTSDQAIETMTYWCAYRSEEVHVKDFVLLTYQEGMENWDIPFFEGMQSVKMPVLTTTGKNLLNANNITLGSYVVGGGEYGNETRFENDAKRAYITIPVKPNTKYTYKSNNIFGYLRCMKNLGVEAGLISMNSLTNTITTTEETNYISINLRHTDETVQQLTREMIDSAEIMFVEGEDASSYEPFKSNILTVNEDVTLRSNGDICDELNLLTGQLMQRIGEDGVFLSH